MYLILKPEVRNHMQTVDEFLSEREFEVISRHPIDNWGRLAAQLYDPQVTESRDFASNLSTYIWLTRRLFGDSAVAMIIEDKVSRGIESLVRLDQTKKSFRE